jgi:hypothetical protein
MTPLHFTAPPALKFQGFGALDAGKGPFHGFGSMDIGARGSRPISNMNLF